MIEVLLVSPRLLPESLSYCGDHAYTDTLLQHPPAGVCYHHYDELLASGQLRRNRFLQAASYYLTQGGFLPPDMWFEALSGDFAPDILHIYGFSATVSLKSKRQIPVVLGQGTGGALDLRFYHGWEQKRIRQTRWRKMLYLKLVGAYDTSQNPRNAAAIHVWSEFSKSLHLAEGLLRPHQIEVIAPGLPYYGHRRQGLNSDVVTFLFIGRDFDRKNGPLMVDAFHRVRDKHSSVRLILVGITPGSQTITEEGITHHQFVPRHELYERIYPQADVLVLPSKAEGFGLVLLEAMSFGMPVISIQAWAMPEIVIDGENGFLVAPNSVDELADRMSRLVEQPPLLAHMRQRAQEVFMEKFSIDEHNRRLRKIYDQVLAANTR